MKSTYKNAMNSTEKTTSFSLAAVYALRMLGMFLIIPVFALYAPNLIGGENKIWVGFAMGGAYGLTQAIAQLPLGIASDRWGRKKIIYVGLIIFAFGSFLAAWADNIYLLTLARAIQGAGAISAAVTALLADLTREKVRTRAMAMIGISIGITFAISMVLGPILASLIGVNGIFALTGVLTLIAILAIAFCVPNPEKNAHHLDPQIQKKMLPIVLKDKQLLRLNFGIFALHTAQMSLFMSLPFALVNLGLLQSAHGWLYLPIVIGSFILMIPAIIYGETQDKLKNIFIGAIGLMIFSQILLAMNLEHFIIVCIALVLYFVAFNILEASLPSMVSKLAPTQAKGTAIGAYNMAQSLGLFAGGAVGGLIFNQFAFNGIFTFCTVLMLIWLILAITAQTPPKLMNILFTIPEIWQNHTANLTSQLQTQNSIKKIAFSDDNKTLYLKIKLDEVDKIKNDITQLLSGDPNERQ